MYNSVVYNCDMLYSSMLCSTILCYVQLCYVIYKYILLYKIIIVLYTTAFCYVPLCCVMYHCVINRSLPTNKTWTVKLKQIVTSVRVSWTGCVKLSTTTRNRAVKPTSKWQLGYYPWCIPLASYHQPAITSIAIVARNHASAFNVCQGFSDFTAFPILCPTL